MAPLECVHYRDIHTLVAIVDGRIDELFNRFSTMPAQTFDEYRWVVCVLILYRLAKTSSSGYRSRLWPPVHIRHQTHTRTAHTSTSPSPSTSSPTNRLLTSFRRRTFIATGRRKLAVHTVEHIGGSQHCRQRWAAAGDLLLLLMWLLLMLMWLLGAATGAVALLHLTAGEPGRQHSAVSCFTVV